METSEGPAVIVFEGRAFDIRADVARTEPEVPINSQLPDDGLGGWRGRLEGVAPWEAMLVTDRPPLLRLEQRVEMRVVIERLDVDGHTVEIVGSTVGALPVEEHAALDKVRWADEGQRLTASDLAKSGHPALPTEDIAAAALESLYEKGYLSAVSTPRAPTSYCLPVPGNTDADESEN